MTLSFVADSSPFQKRRVARLIAVQALYQFASRSCPDDIDQILVDCFQRPYEADWEAVLEFDQDYLIKLVKGAAQDHVNLDADIRKCLSSGWSLERLEILLLSILRVGAYELKAMPDIPTAVLVNEYLEITHAFFYGKEPAFVNGVMARLAQERRIADEAV